MIFIWNLKNFFICNRWPATAFMLLLVVCLAGAMFGANFVYCNLDAYNKYLTEQNTYAFTVSEPSFEADVSDIIRDVNSSYNADTLMIFAQFTNTSPVTALKDSEEFQRYDTVTALYNYGREYAEYFDNSFGMLSALQTYQNDKVILLDSNFYGSEYLGKTYLVNGEEFEVVGFGDGYNFVPVRALDGAEAIQSAVYVFTYSRSLSLAETTDLQKSMSVFYTNIETDFPDSDTLSVFDYLPALLPTFILVLFGFVNLSFLYGYFIQMRSRTYGVFRLCGASSLQIFLLFAAEALVLFSAAFIAGTIVYKIFAVTFNGVTLISVMQSGMLLADRLNFSRWLSIYAVAAICFVAAFTPTLVKAVKNDAVVREEE